MSNLTKIFLAIVALEHLFILVVEMFGWTTKGPKMFKSLPADSFEVTKVVAANMGLYNGFLALGLLWSLMIRNPLWSHNIAMFFVGCVIIAGIYGAISVEKGIFFKQGVPAIITMILLLVM